jgi:hypothetical protein
MSSKEMREITGMSPPTQPPTAAMRTPLVRFASKDQIQLIEGRKEVARRGEDEVGEVQPLPLDTVSELQGTHACYTGPKHILAPTLPLLSLGTPLDYTSLTTSTCPPLTMHDSTRKKI